MLFRTDRQSLTCPGVHMEVPMEAGGFPKPYNPKAFLIATSTHLPLCSTLTSFSPVGASAAPPKGSFSFYPSCSCISTLLLLPQTSSLASFLTPLPWVLLELPASPQSPMSIPPRHHTTHYKPVQPSSTLHIFCSDCYPNLVLKSDSVLCVPPP